MTFYAPVTHARATANESNLRPRRDGSSIPDAILHMYKLVNNYRRGIPEEHARRRPYCAASSRKVVTVWQQYAAR